MSFVACSMQTQYSDNTIELDTEIKQTAKSFNKDIVPLPKEFIYAKSFHVYKDSILIVLNKKNKETSFLEFYNLQTNDSIGQYLSYGQGPCEFLDAKIHLYDNLLAIEDIHKKEWLYLNLDSLRSELLHNPQMIKINTYTFDVIPYKQGSFIMEDLNHFYSEDLGMDFRTERLKRIMPDYTESNEDIPPFYVKNVVGGIILPNFSKERVVYASQYYPIVEIYDDDLLLHKTITGPDDIKPQYMVVDNEVIFKKRIPYSYLAHTQNKDFFYLTYMGNFYEVEKKLINYPLWLFKYDWNGNLLNSFYIGEYVKSISVSGDGKSFYATSYDEEENPILIKLLPNE